MRTLRDAEQENNPKAALQDLAVPVLLLCWTEVSDTLILLCSFSITSSQ